MHKDLARFVVDYGRRLGAEYVEARFQRTRERECLLRKGVPLPAAIADGYGVGIRVIYDGALSFSATNSLQKGNLSRIVGSTVKAAKASVKILRSKTKLSEEKMSVAKWNAVERKKLEDVGIDELTNFLKELDSLLKNGADGVAFPNRLVIASTMVEEKIYVNSEGADLESRVPRVSFHSYITASHMGTMTTVTLPPGYAQMGGSGGWEVMEGLRLHEYLPDRARSLASAIKGAGKSFGQPVDVILGPEVVGLVAHESSGHPGEADRVLGREAAQAGESYLGPKDLGLRVGSMEANVSDDPTIPHSMGFYLYDDEGVKARRRSLIKDGVINEYLHNRATAHAFDKTSNGSSRASRYDREPIVRMANTFVEPGDHSFEELVKDVKLGVYIKSFMEWNIDDKRLNQRYVGLEAYVIERGEVGAPIKNPVVEVNTPKLWSGIDARGNDLAFISATCGKGDPMQGAPVWTGGPHVRFRQLRVGGR